jgi:hypothetical protein
MAAGQSLRKRSSFSEMGIRFCRLHCNPRPEHPPRPALKEAPDLAAWRLM